VAPQQNEACDVIDSGAARMAIADSLWETLSPSARSPWA
jgi:hypothetical protein